MRVVRKPIKPPGQFPKFAAFLHALHDRGALKALAEPNLMKISQEASDLDFANAVVLTGFRIPALRSRRGRRAT